MAGRDNVPEQVAEWERVHNAKSFSIAAGKSVEFEVFLKLFLASGRDEHLIQSFKEQAHKICEIGAVEGYLVAYNS